MGKIFELALKVFSRALKPKGPPPKPPAKPGIAKEKADKDGQAQKPREETCKDCKRKPEKRDISKYENELKDMDRAAAEAKLDRDLVSGAGWEKKPMSDGNGVRYLDGKGNSVQLNNGYPQGLKGGGGDAIHGGPYAKISTGSSISRVPLK